MTTQTRTVAGRRIELFAAIAVTIVSLFTFPAVRVTAADADPSPMQKVQISADGKHFVVGEAGKTFVPWGFNYLGEFGTLLEDSWDKDWERIERDFARDAEARRKRRTDPSSVRHIHEGAGRVRSGSNSIG